MGMASEVVGGPAFQPGFESVLEEIRNEREYQNGRWGTDFDDKNTLNDWVTYIATYCGRASQFASPPSNQRRDMLKVAALAVAACEAFDRNGGFAPRHYEEQIPQG